MSLHLGTDKGSFKFGYKSEDEDPTKNDGEEPPKEKLNEEEPTEVEPTEEELLVSKALRGGEYDLFYNFYSKLNYYTCLQVIRGGN